MQSLKGLSSEKAQGLLEKFGKNILPEKKRRLNFEILIEQVKSPLIYILLFAALVTFFLGDFKDTAVILFAVFINTVLGFYQETKAERALSALSKILTPHAKVIRDGKIKLIQAKLLVPGDLVIVGAGDRIPADGVLVEAVSLFINEAILTGESLPMGKEVLKRTENSTGLLSSDNRHPSSVIRPPERVFMGTTVVSGRGRFLVTATGQETEMGKIAKELATVKQEKTPLQKRLANLARILALMVGGVCLVILVVGITTGNSFIEMFTTSVAIAVAAIPEGMVISLTVILAIGMQRILKRKALVRKLLAAETLGSVTVIASDKTGTLTYGIMRVSKVDLTDKGEALKASVFANNLEDPLEVALWDWAKEQGLDPQKLTDESPRVSEEPFESEKKYMSVTIALPNKTNKTYKTYIKGAPEVLLAKSKVKSQKLKVWMKKIERWSGEGLRIIGLASRSEMWEVGGGNQDLTWLGLIGIEDPVRKDVKEVFKDCRQAGVRVMMVTGDYAGTAKAVWEKIKEEKQPFKAPKIINGTELEKLSFADLAKEINKVDIFARVSPSQKLKIVQALKQNQEVVALVGDGVNDAPAIKQADIGIVVGEASDVARETADMVLLDSNFKTIVAAIEEGRAIFENIKKVILYLLADTFAEVILVTLSILLGVPLPLTAAQILWINLITDGFPSLALTIEPKESGLLRRKPIDKEMPLINLQMKTLIATISTVAGVATLLVFLYFWQAFNLKLARTVAFTALGVKTLLYVFSVRSLSKPIWQVNHLSNPYLLIAVLAGFFLQLIAIYHPFLNNFLETTPLGGFEWIIVLATSVLVIILIETIKFVFARRT